MIEFYKPTPKNTGTACRFWRATNGKGKHIVMCRLVQQVSWTGKNGIFRDNVKNPLKMVIVTFNQIEIGGIIDCIEAEGRRVGTTGQKKGDDSLYHASDNQIVRIWFDKYMRDDEHVGYSFRVQKTLKEDTTQKSSFLIYFRFNEAILLKNFFQDVLRTTYSLDKPQEEEEEGGGGGKDDFLDAPRSSTPPKAEPQEEEDEEVW